MRIIALIAFLGVLLSSCRTEPSIPVKIVHFPVVRFTQNEKCTKKPKVVVIIDTGFGEHMTNPKIHLCKFGHKDFSYRKYTTNEYDTEDPVPVDEHGHGTHIAGLIDGIASKAGVNFCLVIMKYFDVSATGPENLKNSNDAITRAINLHADYINYSGGGVVRSTEEEILVKKFLDQGGKFVAAAGNEGINIDFFHFYPASYDDRIVKVGAVDQNGVRTKISDYGTGVRFELGKNVYSTLPGGQFGYMSGTSQATAIATGKLLAEEKDTCN